MNRMTAAKGRSNGGSDVGKKKRKDRMSRKEAKKIKSDAKSQGHASGNMSVRKIRKYGTSASF